MIDAKYKSDISSANLHQMLAYCALTGATVAVLAVPAGQVADRRSYRFARKGALPVTVHVVEFDVHGCDVAAWRAAASRFAQRVRDACASKAQQVA